MNYPWDTLGFALTLMAVVGIVVSDCLPPGGRQTGGALKSCLWLDSLSVFLFFLNQLLLLSSTTRAWEVLPSAIFWTGRGPSGPVLFSHQLIATIYHLSVVRGHQAGFNTVIV